MRTDQYFMENGKMDASLPVRYSWKCEPDQQSKDNYTMTPWIKNRPK